MRILILLMAISLNLWAEDVKQKATLCASCHGDNGISSNSLWPNLAGQKPDYIVQQLKAFRGGARVNPLMSAVSQTLSEEEMQALAKYYSSLKGAP